jgi:ATP synthase protein I
MENGKKKFSGQIEKSARGLLKAREEKSGFWHYASVFGIGGWLFAIPVVAGAYLGRYLDGKIAGGRSWTLTFIILGIAAGIYNLWHFLIGKGNEK